MNEKFCGKKIEVFGSSMFVVQILDVVKGLSLSQLHYYSTLSLNSLSNLKN